MHIKDRIYGEFDINEPVLRELLKCDALQWLKEIEQHGYFEQYFPGCAFSRYEHSVGVMLLLRKFKASLEEQAAGLIHDVSHTVFSHAGDFIFGTQADQSSQDNYMEQFVRNSDIPTILKKHGFEVNRILDDTKFPLLETKLPDLCADRIDYGLREIVANRKHVPTMTDEEIKFFLASLKIVENHWIVADVELAKKFVEAYSAMNEEVWSGPKAVIMFVSLKKVLQHALGARYLDKSDLFKRESQVWEKLLSYQHTDTTLNKLINELNRPREWVDSISNPDIETVVKSRAVDPLVGEGSKRYSDINIEYKKVLAEKLKPKHYSLKLK